MRSRGEMLEFLSRRLAAALVTLALATVVVFAVVEVLPGDPALVMLGTDARPDTLAALRAPVRFRPAAASCATLRWIGGLLTFDLGSSHAYGTSVAKLIGDRLRRHPAAGALALCWAHAGRDPARRVRRLEARPAGRLGRHGLHPDRHLRCRISGSASCWCCCSP